MTAMLLKVLLKQTRATIESGKNTDSWAIRCHRAISWLAREEKLAASAMAGDLGEARLLYLWIGINALYSRWDSERNAPAGDSYALRDFIPLILQMGGGSVLPMLLQVHKPVVRRIVGNRFLAPIFWRNPDAQTSFVSEDAKHLELNYRNHNTERLLRQVMDRVYVLRCQIVHGASTGGSKLNRGSLNDCLQFMAALTPAVIQMVIERGAGFRWPELCYPPVQ